MIPMSSEISDLMPCAQCACTVFNILQIKYAEKTDD